MPTFSDELEEAWPLVVDYMHDIGSAWVLPALQANPGCRVAMARSVREDASSSAARCSRRCRLRRPAAAALGWQRQLAPACEKTQAQPGAFK